MTVSVYDHNNQMFEVSEARASELILNHGWTRQPTTTVPVDVPPAEIVEDDWRLRYAGLPTLDPEAVFTTPEADEPAETDEEDDAVAEETTPAPTRRRRK